VLWKLTLDTPELDKIGSTGVYEMTDIAFFPDGRLFGVSYTDLYTVDKTTGAATLVGSLGRNDVVALISDSSGHLYAGALDGSFLLIDPDKVPPKVTVVGNNGGALNSSGDLAFDPTTGKLYGTSKSSGNDKLIKVNVQTGVATLIGDLQYPQAYGLAYGFDSLLYGVVLGENDGLSNPNLGPGLVRIDTTTGTPTPLATLGTDGMYGFAREILIFKDGFQTGNTSRWSQTAG